MRIRRITDLPVPMGSQTGTHVDAPYHFADDGPKAAELDLGLFTGPGLVVDVRGLVPRSCADGAPARAVAMDVEA